MYDADYGDAAADSTAPTFSVVSLLFSSHGMDEVRAKKRKFAADDANFQTSTKLDHSSGFLGETKRGLSLTARTSLKI